MNSLLLEKLVIPEEIEFNISNDSKTVYCYLTSDEYLKLKNNNLKQYMSKWSSYDFVFDVILYDEDNSETNLYYKKNNYITSDMIEITDEALLEIARLSLGGMRDALSLLDQAIAYSEQNIKVEDIHEINGTITPQEQLEFIRDILSSNIESLLNKINELFDNVNDKYLKILNILKNTEDIKLANKCCDKIERAASSLNTIFGELSRVREILKFVDEYDNSEINETITEFKKAAGISE